MQAQNEPMKPSILLPALLLWSACADPAPHAILELVESVPSETTLGSEDLRATDAVWMEAFDGASERLDLAFFYTSDVGKEFCLQQGWSSAVASTLPPVAISAPPDPAPPHATHPTLPQKVL